MNSRSKLLEEIHPLHLIREVQMRPVLYTRNNPEMANAHFRHKVWTEVAQSLFPDWHLYTEHSKEDKVLALMKKWRNLRDTFKRQLEVQKKIREGHVIKKKVYVYFKHMSFLLPHVQAGEGEQDGSAVAADADCRKTSRRASAVVATPPPETDTSHYVNSGTVSDIDEDKHFALSLVPSLKRMNEDEKLTAKMEILKVIKAIKSGRSLPEEQYSVEDSLAIEPLATVKLETLPVDLEDGGQEIDTDGGDSNTCSD